MRSRCPIARGSNLTHVPMRNDGIVTAFAFGEPARRDRQYRPTSRAFPSTDLVESPTSRSLAQACDSNAAYRGVSALPVAGFGL